MGYLIGAVIGYFGMVMYCNYTKSTANPNGNAPFCGLNIGDSPSSNQDFAIAAVVIIGSAIVGVEVIK